MKSTRSPSLDQRAQIKVKSPSGLVVSIPRSVLHGALRYYRKSSTFLGIFQSRLPDVFGALMSQTQLGFERAGGDVHGIVYHVHDLLVV